MNVKLDFAIHTLFTVVWEQVWYFSCHLLYVQGNPLFEKSVKTMTLCLTTTYIIPTSEAGLSQTGPL